MVPPRRTQFRGGVQLPNPMIALRCAAVLFAVAAGGCSGGMPSPDLLASSAGAGDIDAPTIVSGKSPNLASKILTELAIEDVTGKRPDADRLY